MNMSCYYWIPFFYSSSSLQPFGEVSTRLDRLSLSVHCAIYGACDIFFETEIVSNEKRRHSSVSHTETANEEKIHSGNPVSSKQDHKTH